MPTNSHNQSNFREAIRAAIKRWIPRKNKLEDHAQYYETICNHLRDVVRKDLVRGRTAEHQVTEFIQQHYENQIHETAIEFIHHHMSNGRFDLLERTSDPEAQFIAVREYWYTS
jgi:hypothetical protein